ncbi:hypothetical protein Y032_0092g2558 [Ancylostoma ceylanicum]|nr:hypothetical protein Y032_0092g2558 [Ancylostoma ceylanicum]
MASAQRFYQKCLTSDDEWKSKGGPITYVMQIIRGYGKFPLIDRTWDAESFDLTKLLAYFNKNKTITYSLVPQILANPYNVSHGLIRFSTSEGLMYNVAVGDNVLDHYLYIDFLLKLAKQICVDTMSQCEDDALTEDIVELFFFSIKLEKIHIHGQKGGKYHRKFRHLHELIGSVNWTEYFLLISPSVVIPHIHPDLETITPSKDTLKVIEVLLQNTTRRVITNYVMLMYAMSWVEHLDEKYRNIAEGYIKGIKSGPPLSAREASCSLATWTNYNHVMMAMHARQNHGREKKKIITVMVDELIAAFVSVIKENKWIEETDKQAILLKIQKIDRAIAYDEVEFLGANQLDVTFEDLVKIDVEKKSFLELMNVFYRKESEDRLRYLDPSKDFREVVFKRKYEPRNIQNAFYAPLLNKINLLIGQDLVSTIIDLILQPPFGLILTPTVFGYTISGTGEAHLTNDTSSTCSPLIVATPFVTSPRDYYKKDINHMYELESLGLNFSNNSHEAAMIKLMNNYRKSMVIQNSPI